ncbi:hypothetical protein NW752_009004 [Fusarium irregulare]|uniref:Ankyrin n=1 Tax=Fusarium irregulare TaxID=2494466 RepID=A0A9W8PJS9_9HYPO|nr:hypothetical protein NW766_009238 [Fusarium irregulare]KAJ4010876.1 hypothetical protein NW752_009004 [Fusarium irregulare]
MHLAMSAHNEKACYESGFSLTALQIVSKLDGADFVYGYRRKDISELFELLLKAGACVDTRHPMQPTALQYVCGNKTCGKYRIETSKLLLKWGADVNAPPAHQEEINGKTALEAAAGVGDLDLVEFLLREGATCSNPASILQLAVASGCQKLVNFLIGHLQKANLSTLNVDDNWVECLEAAARSGSGQLVDTFLKKCSDKSTEQFEKHVINAMEVAASHNNDEALYRLLLSGVNPNADGRIYIILNEAIQCSKDSDTCFSLLMSRCATLQLDLDQPPPGKPTLLWTAIARGNMAVVQRLIISGVNINRTSLCIDEVKGKRLEIPMAQAILCNPCMMRDDSDHACPVDLLVMSGANVDDLVDGSMTALLSALEAENLQAAEKLLFHGANPNIRDSKTGLHAFDIALAGDYGEFGEFGIGDLFSTLKSLVDHGFECNGEFNNGTTIQAVLRKSLEIFWVDDWRFVEMVVEFLIDAGAGVNAPTTDEAPMTALQYAIDTNRKELIDILLAKEADIHAPAFWEKGKTALQTACNDGNLELVKSLVAQGVDINAQPASHYGATALQFAAMQGHIDVAIFLLENGALINAPAALVEGRTALQGAAEHGRLDMIFLLLENDQDDGLEERSQEAARFAEKESRFEIAQILREYRKV